MPRNSEDVLDDIHEKLDGLEWSGDTLEEIASIMRGAGYPIREPGRKPIVKIRAIANDQEGYVMRAYGPTRAAARAKLCEQLDSYEDEEGRGDLWLRSNEGFLTYEEVPEDTDESDAG
jgi:hypothetical protein